MVNPATAKNKNKSSPIKSIHTHLLKGTKRRDDIDESSIGSKVRRNNKPKPSKQNKTMSKIGKQGGVLEGKFNSTTIAAFSRCIQSNTSSYNVQITDRTKMDGTTLLLNRVSLHLE